MATAEIKLHITRKCTKSLAYCGRLSKYWLLGELLLLVMTINIMFH